MEYKINIDGKEHTVDTQFLNGKQIKILVGITEKMERDAKALYSNNEEMGWYAYKVINKPIPDEKIGDNEEVDLVEEKRSKFFTACNGTSGG